MKGYANTLADIFINFGGWMLPVVIHITIGIVTDREPLLRTEIEGSLVLAPFVFLINYTAGLKVKTSYNIMHVFQNHA